MAHIYQHAHAALRTALVDRANDTIFEVESGVPIVIGNKGFVVKKFIPSAALLFSYSMLYYPKFLEQSETDPGQAAFITNWLGGVDNPKFPLFPNLQLAEIAVAVGVYAGIFKAQQQFLTHHMILRPNFNHPLVQETYKRIKEYDLDYRHAREIFIELMQQEEYAKDILLADDYVANAKFIPMAEVTIETTVEELREMAKEEQE